MKGTKALHSRHDVLTTAAYTRVTIGLNEVDGETAALHTTEALRLETATQRTTEAPRVGNCNGAYIGSTSKETAMHRS